MNRGILVDANLLCLLVVGRVDPAAISSHPRLRTFDLSDFANLVSILDRVGDPVLCPHILAETSNLLAFRQTHAQQTRWLLSLADVVRKATERTERAFRIVDDPTYSRLGITDATLLVLAADQALMLMSDDLQLCLEAQRRGIRTINYNYVRDGAVRIDQL